MDKSRFAVVIGAIAGAALMVPAVHAEGDQRRMQERGADQQPVTEGVGGRGTREQVGDQMLETRVKAALVGNDETKARDIQVEVRDSIVHLQGTVDSEADSEEAEQTVKGVDGVRDVRNSLTTQQSR